MPVDAFSAAVDQLCDEIEALPVDVLAGVEDELAGGPLADLARAMHRVARLNEPDRGRHNVARLLLVRAVVDAGVKLDNRTVGEMMRSPDALWRRAGDALALIRVHGPDVYDEPARFRLGEAG